MPFHVLYKYKNENRKTYSVTEMTIYITQIMVNTVIVVIFLSLFYQVSFIVGDYFYFKYSSYLLT